MNSSGGQSAQPETMSPVEFAVVCLLTVSVCMALAYNPLYLLAVPQGWACQTTDAIQCYAEQTEVGSHLISQSVWDAIPPSIQQELQYIEEMLRRGMDCGSAGCL